jgi:hypothetical protein
MKEYELKNEDELTADEADSIRSYLEELYWEERQYQMEKEYKDWLEKLNDKKNERVNSRRESDN